MATVIEETGLARREETSTELQATHAAAMARYEVEGALIVSKKFPRDENRAYQSLMKSAARTTFAEDATYRFPRGGEEIEGPSVYLAREAARLWGNIRYGCDVISADETNIHLRGWAWDTETNARVSCDDRFAKLIYRKKGGWVKPDERDLRELQNRHAAFLIRNCILSLIPCDVVDDVVKEAKKTRKQGAASNLDEYRKATLKAFGILGIEAEELEGYLGKKLATCDADDYSNLRAIHKSIIDGNSKWSEYYTAEKKTAPTGPVTAEAFTAPKAAKREPKKTLNDEPTIQATDEQPAVGSALLHALDESTKVEDVYAILEDVTCALTEKRLTADEAAGLREYGREKLAALSANADAEGGQSEENRFEQLKSLFERAATDQQRIEARKGSLRAYEEKLISIDQYKELTALNMATNERLKASAR